MYASPSITLLYLASCAGLWSPESGHEDLPGSLRWSTGGLYSLQSAPSKCWFAATRSRSDLEWIISGGHESVLSWKNFCPCYPNAVASHGALAQHGSPSPSTTWQPFLTQWLMNDESGIDDLPWQSAFTPSSLPIELSKEQIILS